LNETRLIPINASTQFLIVTNISGEQLWAELSVLT